MTAALSAKDADEFLAMILNVASKDRNEDIVLDCLSWIKQTLLKRGDMSDNWPLYLVRALA